MPSISYRLDPDEIVWTAIRSQGSGGQTVNKVSSAVQLRFDVQGSTLPDELKQRLLALHDQRLNSQGEIIIKSQVYRTQEQNRADAWERLCELVRNAAFTPRKRKATKATRASKERRLKQKSRRSEIKRIRQERG
jgi:ribosome-associated protein